MQDPATPPRETTLQWVRFEVGIQSYAVPLLAVQAIEKLKDIAGMPMAPAFMEGVINLRGMNVAVVDLRKRFGTTILDQTGNERILFVEMQDDTRVVGLVVDAVSHVLSVDSDAIEPASKPVDNSAVEAVIALDAGPLHLLSLPSILSRHELESAIDAANNVSTALAA